MHLTFRQIKLFLALAETGSVSAAAKATHVTQPTASMQLKEIAQSVGMPVYELIGKKIHLTDAGRELAQTARAIASAWDGFEQYVDSSKGLTRGRLRVAVVSTAKYFVPRMLGDFCKKHPAIDVSLEVLNRNGVVERLRENMDDLYIMSMPPTDVALSDEVFMRNPLVMIAATKSPLTKRSVSLSQLMDERFILREPGSGTRMAADIFFRQHKFRPNIRLELGSNEAIKEAVAGGLGMGLVSLHALHGRQREHGIAVVDVAGLPIASNWHMVHPRAKKLSPIAAAFKQHLLEQVALHPAQQGAT